MKGNPNITEYGAKTRFKRGNRAAVGNRGGRPRKVLTEKLNRYSEFALDALYKKARDKDDPERFMALRELARLCTPRRKEVAGDAGGDLEVKLSVEALRMAASEARVGGGEAAESGAST